VIVKITNPTVSGNINTALSQDYTSGSTLNVDSSAGFVNGNYIIVGEPGLEKTEITSLTATPGSATTLTVTALSYSHPKGTPVYFIRWDKYSLEYQSTSGGAFAVYGGMPADLRYDAISTEYRDASATTSYSWKYRYYSTENSVYSDYSDTIAASGWPRTSVGYMVREIRKIVNDPESRTISDEEIIRFLNSAQDKIYALYDRWWFLFKIGTVIDTVASQKIYNLPSDFGRMHSVQFRYNPTSSSDITYNLKYLPMTEFDYEARDNSATDNDEVVYYTIFPGDSTNATGYVHVWPVPETAGYDMTPRYYKTFTDLDSYADETEIPIPAIIEDYALAQIYKIRKEENKADFYDKNFREQIELLKLEQRKVVGSPRYLWKYVGPHAEDRLFGTRGIYSDSDRERNW